MLDQPTVPPTATGRLGIMGGSFDPPHCAHLLIAEAAREALNLDLVLFVPARQQPLKSGYTPAPADDRVAMCRLAIEGNLHFALSTLEVNRPGPSYTVDTLRELCAEWGHSHPEVWFIVGADSLASLPRWRDPQGILALARLAVMRRPGVEVDMDNLRSHIPGLESRVDWVDAPLFDISSTGIRARVALGRSVRYRVPEAVRDYIQAHGLYREPGA